MLANQPRSLTTTTLLVPGEKENTAGATSAWVDISGYEGHVEFIAAVGVVGGGSIAMKIQEANDDQADGLADSTGGGFTTVTTSNDPLTQTVVLNSNGMKKFVRFLGTVTTGPADVCVLMRGRLKTAT